MDKVNREFTTVYLDKPQKTALKALAQLQSEQAHTRVSMADLVRQAVDIFLASNVRVLKQNDMNCEAPEAR